MRFLLLGGLELHGHDGTRIRLNRTKHRQLLALLLLQANNAISTEQLVDGMWPDDPPHSAKANIKTYVSAIRPLVATAGGRIETVPRGYQLLVDPDSVDKLLFDKYVHLGTRAAREGDDELQVEYLERAIRLWRGDALQDLPPGRGPLLDAATRMHEKFVSVLQDLTAGLMRLDRNDEAIDYLRMALSREPLRERSWSLLMIALHRDGRQADSLSAYLKYRAMLVDTMGLEPGRALRELHQKILTGETIPPDGLAGAASRPSMTRLNEHDRVSLSGMYRPGELPRKGTCTCGEGTG